MGTRYALFPARSTIVRYTISLSYTRPICLPWGMDDQEREWAIDVEYAAMTVFMAGAFVAGLVALVKDLLS